jgi:hypothetical protein
MPFVKLDSGILNSSLWLDIPAREVFITALLMAEPHELLEPAPQIEVRSLGLTGWSVPAGWYGHVPAAGVGIIRRAGVDLEAGYEALQRLGEPEADSRSHDHGGRRLVRVDGGYLVLNFIRYREKDVSGAERQRRWRDRKRNALRDGGDALHNALETQAEAEAEAYVQKTDSSASASVRSRSKSKDDDAGTILAYWLKRTGYTIRSPKVNDQILARIKARLRDGCSSAELRACVEFALVDQHYVASGYAKQPVVIWKNAERVSTNAQKWEALSGQVAGRDDGPSDEELAALDAETDR